MSNIFKLFCVWLSIVSGQLALNVDDRNDYQVQNMQQQLPLQLFSNEYFEKIKTRKGCSFRKRMERLLKDDQWNPALRWKLANPLIRSKSLESEALERNIAKQENNVAAAKNAVNTVTTANKQNFNAEEAVNIRQSNLNTKINSSAPKNKSNYYENVTDKITDTTPDSLRNVDGRRSMTHDSFETSENVPFYTEIPNISTLSTIDPSTAQKNIFNKKTKRYDQPSTADVQLSESNEKCDKKISRIDNTRNAYPLATSDIESEISEVSSRESWRFVLMDHSRACYTCNSLNDSKCWIPNRGTTIKYCRKGYNACITNTYLLGGTNTVVIRDCAATCDIDIPFRGVSYISCTICKSDFCNKVIVNSAPNIWSENILIPLIFLSSRFFI